MSVVKRLKTLKTIFWDFKQPYYIHRLIERDGTLGMITRAMVELVTGIGRY